MGNPGQSLDLSFGQNGVVRNLDAPGASAIVKFDTDKLVTGGGDFFLCRYLSDGSLDPTFGTNGNFDIAPGGTLVDVEVDSNSLLYALGTVSSNIVIGRFLDIPLACPGGSCGDILMETQINGSGNPIAPFKSAMVGDSLDIFVSSPGLTLVGTVPAVVGQFHLPGNAPPSPGGFPEIAVNPFYAPAPFTLFDGNQSYTAFGPTTLPANGFNLAVMIPPAVVGFEVTLQALAITGMATNGFFESSIPHRVTFQ